MENKKSRDPLYITIIVVLLGLGGAFAWQWNTEKNLNEQLTKDKASMQADLDTLKNLLEKNGMVDLMGEDLKDNLQFMLDEYAQMKTTNDTLNTKLGAQQEKIKELLEQAERHKGDAYAILKLKKEAETLRKIMKSYIHTIDSLNTVNQGLVVEIKNKDKTISDVSAERDEVVNKNKNLEEKVAKGSLLQTSGLSSVGIRIRSSGKQVETTKAGRVDMIKTCLTILENRIAKAGPKDIYMVVITPGGSIVSDNPSVTVNTDEGSTPFSLKREVDYQNANLDLCMYAEVKEGVELTAGTYIVKIYCEKALIGKSTFTLK
jgi:Holliday junction resolvase